jgi:hypothetical protein
MKRLIQLIMVLVAGLVTSCRQSVSTQAKTADLPSSPYALPAPIKPQSASYSRDAARALELHAASTNAAVIQLLGEIRDMKQSLSVLESNAWQKDPLLLTCDRYIEKAHEWVMEKHHAEMEADSLFFYSTNQAVAVARQKIRNDLSAMIHLILLKDLGDNTNFAFLIKSTFDVMAWVYQQNTNSALQRDNFFNSYRKCDRLIGYRTPNPAPGGMAYADFKAEVDRRYDLLTARVAQIQREQHIPPEAVAGVKFGELYRTLDGAAEVFLDVRTPPDVQKLRQDLQRKMIDLSWLLK